MVISGWENDGSAHWTQIEPGREHSVLRTDWQCVAIKLTHYPERRDGRYVKHNAVVVFRGIGDITVS